MKKTFKSDRAFTASCAILVALGIGACTTTAQPTFSQTAALCDALRAADDDTAATALDLPVLVLAKLKEIGKTDNTGVCRMPEDARNKIMASYRNSFKNPDRKKFRAPAKEFMQLWDAGDDGKPPNATMVLAAENQRLNLLAPAGTSSKGRAERAINQAAGITSNQWNFIGPGNIGGRVRAILIDPRNPGRLLIGAASGGIWLSNNAGLSFTAVQDFMGNIAIGAMAFDPSDANIVYAGTGESFSGLSGIGMFKSVDSGITWNYLAGTTTDTSLNSLGNDWVFVNRIAVSRTNSNIVLAATTNGNLSQGALMRSANGGVSWTKVGSFRALDVQFDPNNANNVLAGSDDGYLYLSNDGGTSWNKIGPLVTTLTGRSTTARAEIAWAANVPNLVYISLDNNKGEVWKSFDGGQNWAMISNPAHLNDQGDYDNTIWVSPLDSNHLVVGGLDLYRSTDAGVNFTKISNWQIAGPGVSQPHADHHVIVSVPGYSNFNPVVYIGNDGGVYRSSDIFSAAASGVGTWSNLNNNLGVTQFYGGAGSRAAGGKIIGGTQDNGTLILNANTNWDRFAGGDGGYVAVDPVSDATLYGEYVYASIHRTVDLNTRQYICTGITEGLKAVTGGNTYCGANATEQANFISPFILDPNIRDRMLVGANSLWASNNIRDADPSWTAIKPPVPLATQSKHYINAIVVQPGNANVIWVGLNGSNSSANPTHIYRTADGLSAAPTWQLMTKAGMPSSTINRITIDQSNPNRVWVAYSGVAPNRLWQTIDGGINWTNISGNLPFVTLHDIKRHPTRADWLYVAAANGVYTSENGGVTWSTSNDGPASVRVRELFWYDNHTLVAATYGRGMFTYSLAFDAVLSVTQVGSGSGVVTSNAGGVNCGTSCSATLNAGTVATLTATANAGSVFAGWSGACSGTAACQVTLNDSVTVSAKFNAQTPIALAKRGGIDILGNGKGSIVLRSASAQLLNATLVNDQFLFGNLIDPGAEFRLVGIADFDGNGKSDLAFQNPTALDALGRADVLAWNDLVPTNQRLIRPVKPAWVVQAVGDFDGDGLGDMVFRWTGFTPDRPGDTGVSYIWFATGANGAANPFVRKRGGAPLDWTLLGAMDLNGDGAADMIYISPAGAIRALMATPARTCANLAAGNIAAGFSALKLADFTGNSRGDILLRNAATGEVQLLSLNAFGLALPAYAGDPEDQNASCTASALTIANTSINLPITDPAWMFYAAADFNGDGVTDIVWLRPDNTLTVWLMNSNAAILRVINNAGAAPTGYSVFQR